MSNKETIKSRVELYVQTHGSDCLLEDVATEAYGRTVTAGELEYVAAVIRDAGYTFRTNVAVWGIDDEDIMDADVDECIYIVKGECSDTYDTILYEEFNDEANATKEFEANKAEGQLMANTMKRDVTIILYKAPDMLEVNEDECVILQEASFKYSDDANPNGDYIVSITDKNTGEEYYNANYADINEADDMYMELVEEIHSYIPGNADVRLMIVNGAGDIMDARDFDQEDEYVLDQCVVLLETADHYEVLVEENIKGYNTAYARFEEIATDVDFYSGGVDCVLSLNKINPGGKGYETVDHKEFTMEEGVEHAEYVGEYKVEVRDSDDEDLIETTTTNDEEAAYEAQQELAIEYRAENKAVLVTTFKWNATEGEYEFLGEVEVFIDGPLLSEVNPFQVSLLTSDNDQVWHFPTVEAAQEKFDSLLERLNRADGVKATLSIVEVSAESPFTKTIAEEIF